MLKTGYRMATFSLGLLATLSVAASTTSRAADGQASPVAPPVMVLQEVPDEQLSAAQKAALPNPAAMIAATQEIGGDAIAAAAGIASGGPLGIINAGVVILDAMTELGKGAWDLIQKGSPVLDVKTDWTGAVPSGIKNWTELEGWRPPVTKVYCAGIIPDHYFDCSKTDPNDFEQFWFRVVFTPGGNYQGHGEYLTAITIVPAQLSVGYAHYFMASTQVVSMKNYGTAADPIAGIELKLSWSSDELFQKYTQTMTFTIKGDGSLTHDKPSVQIGKALIPRILGRL
jgi:hypothetical protein